jgi:hypothetical protein
METGMAAIRLAFTGASGTGKTTLARWVEKEFGLPFNPVGSRSVAKAMGFDNPYDVDAAGQRGPFQHRLVEDKRAWEDAHESFVVDRTTLDNLVYTMLHDVYAINAELMQKIADGMKRYTHIVFCPFDVFHSMGDDPNRVGGGKYEADDTYHKLYELVLKAVVQDYRPVEVPMTRLLRGDLPGRQAWVGRFIRGQEPMIE